MAEIREVANYYCGVGGNRAEWGDEVHVTAIEYDPEIAAVYQDLYPNDTVIVCDAHHHMLENYMKFDFIWSSPPCQTHSQIRYNIGFKANRKYSKVAAKYPDMKLYEEILMLKYYCQTKWVVENTIPFYPPLVEGLKTGGHIWWSNFEITPIEHGTRGHRGGTVETLQDRKAINLDKYSIGNKRQILRNCVEPEVGKHVFLCAQHSMHQTAVGVGGRAVNPLQSSLFAEVLPATSGGW